MQVKSAKAYEVSNETFESQEARYANKDDYLRARKLDKLTNAKKREEEGFHRSKYRISDNTIWIRILNFDETNVQYRIWYLNQIFLYSSPYDLKNL